MTARFRSKSTANLALVPPPADHDSALRRTAAVQRRLAAASPDDTDEDLVRAFVQTMSLHDAELRTWGYAENIQGAYELHAVADDVDRTAGPDALWLENEPADNALFRLAPQDVHQLEFGGDADVVAARIGDRAVRPWLIVLSGAIPTTAEPRLTLCLDLLDQALKASARRAATRVRWCVLEHLLSSTGRTRAAAESALAALTAATGGAGAALLVSTAAGVHVFSAGQAETFAMPAVPGEAADIVTTAPVLDQYSMTLAVRRTARVPFTGRERHLLEVAAPLFATWLCGALRPSVLHRDERRAVSAC